MLWWEQGHTQSLVASKEFIEEQSQYSSQRLDDTMLSGVVNSAWRHVELDFISLQPLICTLFLCFEFWVGFKVT